jgi:hypothetical protein
MGKIYKYTWKNGIEMLSAYAVAFNQELVKDKVFVDLRNGDAHRVFSVHKAKDNDRDNADMPEDVVQTFLIKALSEKELESLRQECKYVNGEPEYVIIPNEATC